MTSRSGWKTFYGAKIVRGKTKKTGKPKVYNLYTILRSSLRQTWMRSPAKQEAERAARVDRGQYLCATCQKLFGPKEIQVDHIVPVVDPILGFVGWDAYVDRMFCGPEGLQVLCKPCHKQITDKQREIRRRGAQGELLEV